MQINVDGDKETGWIVGVHNGDVFRTYSPENCETVEDAAEAALAAFEEEHGETKTEVSVVDHRATLAPPPEKPTEEEPAPEQEPAPEIKEPGPETS